MPGRVCVDNRQTARLVLRKIARDDRDFLVDLFSRQELVAHRPHPVPDAPEVIDAQLDRDIGHWERYRHGRWLLLCAEQKIGIGGLTVRPDVDGLNLSYHLHPRQWRQGFASEFVAGALRVGFSDLGAERIVALIRPGNAPSQRVVENARFKFESVMELDGAPTQLFAISRHHQG